MLLSAACASSPSPPFLDRLHPCSSSQGPNEAYCGSLSVFEDRAAGNGRRISLNIVVLPSLADRPRPDPLFFLAGGPGQGAAQMARTIGALFARVRRERDIVLVDQRGTGKSNPLNCPSETESLQTAFASDDVAMARLRECLAGFDADVRLYTTDIAMDDLDDVRRHLGYDLVNLYGGSYGSRAALVYLRRHGSHVRSVVLDGVAPTSMRLPLFAARDAERALTKLLNDCERDDACRAAYPRLASRVAALLQRLDREPAHVRITHPRTGMAGSVDVTARAVASAILGALYSPVTGTVLPILIGQAEMNDFQGLFALAFAGDSADNLSVGMQLSVLCSEDAPSISADDVAREAAHTMFGVHLVTGQLKACSIWPKGRVEPDYFDPVNSDVPALILSGDIDPVTPASWGETVVQHLTRGRHLVAPATGHGVLRAPCGARLIAEFLEKGSADALDAGCLARSARPPFFLTPSGPDPASASAP